MEPYFTRGIQEEIALAKREYRRVYKANWKRVNRTECKEVTIKLSKKEYQELRYEAKEYQYKLAPFIKASCMAYIRKTYLIPDAEIILKLFQLQKMMYLQVEDMKEQIETHNVDVFLKALEKLEHEMRVLIHSPLDIERAIKKHIAKDEDNKRRIQELLHGL
jgi:hypothetical protein